MANSCGAISDEAEFSYIRIIIFRSSQLVSNYCDGVDLNCGCPQGWAQKEGIGACLINNPKFVSDVVKQTKNQCKDDLGVSVKIRIHSDIERYLGTVIINVLLGMSLISH